MKLAFSLLFVVLISVLGLQAKNLPEGTTNTTVHAGQCPTPPFHIHCRRMVCLPQMIEKLCNDDSTCRTSEKCCHKMCSCTTKCLEAVNV
ncbi:unnamed protein product [Didymodactylos carnosus]|uniref:WAP domain-containing protein n=1 Tax=Didymodactylos carnosus TaxID=1234261 RepID=A0A814ZX96_9BILA|nr:unnamed protein product [Didymodactylos carnosus]CAF1322184.1 unnamed protein product [Didymodactylos carnosus]CAF4015410.1 unnamed protein product [Didymodactylos carnosus]CAF4132536.1 unnamed protein product [Didymodactylos carnosus]